MVCGKEWAGPTNGSCPLPSVGLYQMVASRISTWLREERIETRWRGTGLESNTMPVGIFSSLEA